MLLYDITNKTSFYNLFNWIDQYNAYNDMPIKNIIIAGNKHDLTEKREISEMEAEKFAESMEC